MSRNEANSTSSQESSNSARKLRSVGSGAVSIALRHSPERVRRGAEDFILRKIISSPGFDVRLLTEHNSIIEVAEVLGLEQKVWFGEEYGDLYDYKKYYGQSRVFAAYKEGKCIGMNRLFAGAPEIPPFAESDPDKVEIVLPYYDENLRQKLIEGCRDRKVEEYGTVAVDEDYRRTRAFLDLCRLAYRDATNRDIEVWGIIMEPERVGKMNKSLGFTFEQVGPVIDYQGGDCAAHIMYFSDVRHNMSSTKPQLYNWFVNQPL